MCTRSSNPELSPPGELVLCSSPPQVTAFTSSEWPPRLPHCSRRRARIGAAPWKITLAISHNHQAKRPRNPTHLAPPSPIPPLWKRKGFVHGSGACHSARHPYRSHAKHRPQDTEGDRHDGILLQPGWSLKILAIPVTLEALTLTTMASPKASATAVAHVSSATR